MQVMQMCDGVMASGHNVMTFAVPALQPLVLNLFMQSTRLSADVETQRLAKYHNSLFQEGAIVPCTQQMTKKCNLANIHIFICM